MATKPLISSKIDSQYDMLIDPDNVFWAVSKSQSSRFVDNGIAGLYSKVKDELDGELKDFRFSANLTAVYIDPTDRCNADCPYCYIPSSIRKNGRSMTDGELDFILKKLAKYFQKKDRRAVVVFHASEPLLVKDVVFKAIQKFKRQFRFGLQTNATLLKRQDVDFLKKQRVGVGISLDSNLAYVNNRLRPAGQDGNFKSAVQAIEWFGGYEGLNVITTITKFNVSGLPEIVTFLHSKKVPCVLLNPVRLTQKTSRNLRPSESLMAKYFIKAVDTAIRLSRRSSRRIIIGNFTNVILGIIAPAARRLMCDISPCGGARCFFTVTAKGEMIPCGEFIGLKGFRGGNIFKNSIEEAMDSYGFRRIRQRFVEKIEECDICMFRNICGAPCPAELHALGNMYQRSVFCEFYKQIIAYAFKLIAHRKEKYLLRKEGLNNLSYIYRLSSV